MKQTFILLGSPVAHSLSPRMMTAAFKHCKIDAVYKAIDCKESDLGQWIAKIRSGEIAGANMTMPYKKAVIEHLDCLTPAAKKIGAVNVIFRRGNKMIGDNTDGMGFLTALHASRNTLHASQVIVIGAGGAAKAISHALVDAGISSLVIINRRRNKAEQLATKIKSLLPKKRFTLHACPPTCPPKLKERRRKPWRRRVSRFTLHPSLFTNNSSLLLINATPLGSPGRPWPSLDFVKQLPKDTIVFDIVTHPTETPLIRAAKKRGLKVVYGHEMLLHQGALTFERWKGKKAPIDVMKRAIMKTLSPKLETLNKFKSQNTKLFKF